MASTPAGSWPVTEPAGEVTGVAEALGGAVHLACAETPLDELSVVVAGFSGYEPQTTARARTRLNALRALRRLPGEPPAFRPGETLSAVPGAELRLSDFMAEPPPSVKQHIGGAGLVSGRRYRLPAEVVWAGGRECLVEPVLSGVVDSGVPEAIAEVVAHDVVARWWADPREPLLRVSASLGHLLPPG
ncbi:MAG: hypothetical protein HOY71_50735, partial [Nonomuraea sp.]|nr:hypothetical protein [Nonomuraea sp.]